MDSTKLSFAGQDVMVYTLQSEGQKWFLANPFATILNYARSNKAVATHVSSQNQRLLCDLTKHGADDVIRAHHCGALTSSLHPQTKFINQAGLFELIQGSKTPKAQEFRQWVSSDLLPKLCNTGVYDMQTAPVEQQQQMMAVHQVTNNGTNAAWSLEDYQKNYKELATKSKVMLLEKDNEIMVKTNELMSNKMQTMELQHNYERQIMEYKNAIKEMEMRELRLQNAVADMQRKMSMTTIEFGVNALLAKDNIEENDELRANIQKVEGRVIPQMSSQPDKEHYTSFYLYSRNGDVYVIVMRVQLKTADYMEKIQKQLKSNILKRPRDVEKYEWLKYANRIIHEKTPNAISLWNKIKEIFGDICYGFKFESKSMNKFRFCTEQEIREKYRRDTQMCKDDKKHLKVQIDKFKSLGFDSEDDAVQKCWTQIPDATKRLKYMVDKVLKAIQDEVTPKHEAKRYDNVDYSVDQIVSAVNSYNRNFCNSYIHNLNIITRPIEDVKQ
ncbi:bro [Trichoplusia ni granulovirus LBIV-12]|uniref:Bro n=2 Tax=Betabaculovirus TaxID=558017 RepID=A0A1D8QL76_GVTN|nr:BRO [Pseudalatia unipuncta granulovirus]YP_009506119.1 bro [Trichoplusia ni granulovirus LBIV-12]ACH69406.1 BRO [Pseudalatia unipuncta granulovirus]AOW41388.1 bro [Trichoplusia ni granulovirus LBIV-12]